MTHGSSTPGARLLMTMLLWRGDSHVMIFWRRRKACQMRNRRILASEAGLHREASVMANVLVMRRRRGGGGHGVLRDSDVNLFRRRLYKC